MVEQHSQHLPHATDAMKVYGHVAARWLQVAENGRLPTHALEVVQRAFDASRFRIVHRIRPWADHFLVAWWFRWYIRQLLGHRAAGDGHALAMESAMVEQHSQHLPHATDAMKVYGHVAARWLQVAENGRLPTHALEVVQRAFDASRFRDCENVKHGVGRALSRHDCRNRVPDGLPRDDVARLEILLDRILEHSCISGDQVQLFLIFRRHEWRVNQTQAERGNRARHSVCGVLSPTDANARARIALDALKVFA